MKKSLILLTALISLFYHAGNAQAAFLIEPYGGTLLSSTMDVTAAADGMYDATGTEMGARVGFQNMGLMLGLDYRMISNSVAHQTDPTITDTLTGTQMGLFVGYDFPIMLRVWYEYIFSKSLTDDDDIVYAGGSGSVIGIGYKIIPFLSLNLEIGSTATSTGTPDGGTESDLDLAFKTYTFSVSFPFSI